VAICNDAISGANGAGERADALAMSVAFDFLDRAVLRLPRDRFELTEIQVLKIVDAIQREHGGVGPSASATVEAPRR
jgi:hypothetical protein